MTAGGPDLFKALSGLAATPQGRRVLDTLKTVAAEGGYTTSRTETTTAPPARTEIDLQRLKAEILAGFIRFSADNGGAMPDAPHKVAEVLNVTLADLRERGVI